MPTTDDENVKPPWTLLAGLVVLTLGVGAYLALVLTDHAAETDKLLTFLGPSVAALIIVGHQQRQQTETKGKLEEATQALAVITKQTNGVLDQRIKDRTTEALRDYDIAGDVQTALASMLEGHLLDRNARDRTEAPA